VDGQLLWSFNAPDRLIGGPVVDRDGRLYLNGKGGVLYRLAADGAQLGTKPCQQSRLGLRRCAPMAAWWWRILRLASRLTIQVAQRLWHYRSDPPHKGRASPIVRSDGMTYVWCRIILSR
jgi:outer membrane protein assembly factor BamB